MYSKKKNTLDKDLLEIEEFKEDILDALEDGEYEEAEDIADEAIEMFPEESFGYYYMAEALFMQFDYEEALHYYFQALERSPEHAEYLSRVALMYSKLGEQDRSAAYYKHVIQVNDKHTDALIALGVLAFNENEYQDAISYLNNALKVDKDLLPAYQIRAMVHEANDDFKSALSDIDHCIKKDPNSNAFLKQKIDLLIKYEKLNDVKKIFKALISIDEYNVEHYVAYGDFLYSTKALKEAQEMYSQSILKEVYGDLSALSSFMKRGQIKLELGNFSEAYKDFSRVVELDPNIIDAHIGMVDCKIAEKDMDFAMQLLKIAELSVVKHYRWRIYRKLGDVHVLRNEWDDAIKQYQLIIDTEDDEIKAEGHYSLGNLYQKNGNLESAYHEWQCASKIFHLAADEKIENHCQEFIHKELKEKELSLIEDLQKDFTNNAKSKILSKFFSDFWLVDLAKTTESNKFLKEIPSDMAKQINAMLSKICILIRPSGMILVNPGTDGVRMVYSIEKENNTQVTIFGIPLNGKKEKQFSFKNQGNYMILNGFGEEDADIDLFLKPIASKSGLPTDISKLFSDLMNKGETEFLGKEVQNIF